ncbi:hypothetical protein, partial [Burkholderia pseudomallei]
AFGFRLSAFGFRLSAFGFRFFGFSVFRFFGFSVFRFFGFRVSDFEREIDAPARARAPSGSPRGRLQASRGASS